MRLVDNHPEYKGLARRWRPRSALLCWPQQPTACLQVMERVFRRYTGPEWRPKRYAEGKGRYLWTDAFGVVNFISLFKATEQDTYLKQVLHKNERAAIEAFVPIALALSGCQ